MLRYSGFHLKPACGVHTAIDHTATKATWLRREDTQCVGQVQVTSKGESSWFLLGFNQLFQNNQSICQVSESFNGPPPSQSIVLQVRLLTSMVKYLLLNYSDFCFTCVYLPLVIWYQRWKGRMFIPLKYSAVVPWGMKSCSYLVKQTDSGLNFPFLSSFYQQLASYTANMRTWRNLLGISNARHKKTHQIM